MSNDDNAWRSACDNFATLLHKRLEEAKCKSPERRYDELVNSGLINRNGELTRQYGGDAEPEKGDSMTGDGFLGFPGLRLSGDMTVDGTGTVSPGYIRIDDNCGYQVYKMAHSGYNARGDLENVAVDTQGRLKNVLEVNEDVLRALLAGMFMINAPRTLDYPEMCKSAVKCADYLLTELKNSKQEP